MVRLAFLSFCLFASSAALAQSPLEGQVLQHGPAQGMSVGTVVSTEGAISMVSLGASPADSSPLPDGLQQAVTTLLAARDGHSVDAQAVVAEGAVGRFCPLRDGVMCESDTAFVGFPVPNESVANTPYLLSDGRVRIEWLVNDEVAFLTFISFANEQLTVAETARAVMPVRSASSGGAVQ